MYKVYGDIRSGNCYKIKLLMSFLDIEHEWIHVDILAGETHTDSFLSKNPNAKIPLLEIDAETFLAESNAILHFLGEESSFIPDSKLERARVLEWQFFEQYSHEPYIAVARFINLFLGLPDDRKDEYLAKQAGGYKALDVMENQLKKTNFLIGERVSLADVSLFAYTHVAHEGGFDLAKYPAIRDWIQRIQALPGFVAMTA